MKILKPGKVMLVKLDCPYCGCEFACDPVTEIKAEHVIEYKPDWGGTKTLLHMERYVGCPCCGKRFRVDFDELPEYKGESTQDDRERLMALLDYNCGYTDDLPVETVADMLIENGVTFRD